MPICTFYHIRHTHLIKKCSLQRVNIREERPGYSNMNQKSFSVLHLFHVWNRSVCHCHLAKPHNSSFPMSLLSLSLFAAIEGLISKTLGYCVAWVLGGVGRWGYKRKVCYIGLRNLHVEICWDFFHLTWTLFYDCSYSTMTEYCSMTLEQACITVMEGFSVKQITAFIYIRTRPCWWWVQVKWRQPDNHKSQPWQNAQKRRFMLHEETSHFPGTSSNFC